jgi:hypothetical protein
MFSGVRMNLTWFRCGAAALVVLGVGHLALSLPRSLRRSPQQRAIDEVMRAHVVRIVGRDCNLRDLNAGFSLAMGLLSVAFGVADLLYASTPGIVASSSLAWLNLAVSLILWVVSVRAFPPPPIVVLAVASVCFGMAL